MNTTPIAPGNLGTDAFRPEVEHAIEFERKRRLFRNLLWIGCAVFWSFSMYTSRQNETVLNSIVFFLAGLTSIWLVLIYFLKDRRFLILSARLFIFLLAALLCYYLIFGGPGNARSLWSYTFPLVAFYILGSYEGSVWVAFFILTQGMLLSIPALNSASIDYAFDFKFRFILSQLIVAVMTGCFEYGRQKAAEAMWRNQCLLKESEARTRRAFEKLKVAQGQLVQSGKLASIGELAAGVAHELNQPLMVIRGNAQLIKRQLGRSDKSLSEQMPSFFETIARNTHRMMAIINHLRSFSRQSSAEFSSVDINGIIEDAFLMIGEQLRLHGIKVVKDLADGLPKVRGNANQLEQVFLNLLSNSRDAFHGCSTGRQRNQSYKRLIIVTRPVEGEDQSVEILFNDNGCGITSSNLGAIFDPFFTTKRAGTGTGLGLSISYGIIQSHEGRIEVMDTGPRGTTFRIVLPALHRKKSSKMKVLPSGNAVGA